ncbi:MAG: hypothetical protein ABIJ86_03710 [Spirochaetota bacterium]
MPGFFILDQFGIGIQTVEASLAVWRKQPRLSALVKVLMNCDQNVLFPELLRTGELEKI